MIRVQKTVKYKKETSFLGTVQYAIGFLIALGFAVGIIPGQFDLVSKYLLILIAVQTLISLLRVQLLHALLELFLLFFGFVGMLPFLGWFLRILGFIVAVLDMSTFKNTKIYKQVEIRTIDKFKGKKKPSKKPQKVEEAQFKEK